MQDSQESCIFFVPFAQILHFSCTFAADKDNVMNQNKYWRLFWQTVRWRGVA